MYNESLENKHHFMTILKESDIHKKDIERNFIPEYAEDYRKINAVWTAAFVELIKSGVQYIDLMDKYRIVIDDENYDISKESLRNFLGEDNYETLFHLTAGNLVTAKEVNVVTHTNENVLQNGLLALGYKNPFGPVKQLQTSDPFGFAGMQGQYPVSGNTPGGQLTPYGAQSVPQQATGQYFPYPPAQVADSSAAEQKIAELEGLLEKYKAGEKQARSEAELAKEASRQAAEEKERAEKREQHIRMLKEQADKALQETDELRIQAELEKEKFRYENERLVRERDAAESKVHLAHEEISRMDQERKNVEDRLMKAREKAALVEKQLKEAKLKESEASEDREKAREIERQVEERTEKLMAENVEARNKLNQAVKGQRDADQAYQKLNNDYNQICAEIDELRKTNQAVSAGKEKLQQELKENAAAAELEKNNMKASVEKLRQDKMRIEKDLSTALQESMSAQNRLAELDRESSRLEKERMAMQASLNAASEDIVNLKKETEKLAVEKADAERKLQEAKEKFNERAMEFKGSMDAVVQQKREVEEKLKNETAHRVKAEETARKNAEEKEKLLLERNELNKKFGELSKKEAVAKTKADEAIREKDKIAAENQQIKERLENLQIEKENLQEQISKALKEAADASRRVREAGIKVKQAIEEKNNAIQARKESEQERLRATAEAERLTAEKEQAEANLKAAEADRVNAHQLLKAAMEKEKIANEQRKEANLKLREAEQERKNTLQRLTELEREQTATEQELENARAQKLSAQQWAQKASQMAQKAQEERDLADAELRKARDRIRETEAIEKHMKWENEYAGLNLDVAKKKQEESIQKMTDASTREYMAGISQERAEEEKILAEQENKEALDNAARLRIEQGRVNTMIDDVSVEAETSKEETLALEEVNTNNAGIVEEQDNGLDEMIYPELGQEISESDKKDDEVSDEPVSNVDNEAVVEKDVSVEVEESADTEVFPETENNDSESIVIHDTFIEAKPLSAFNEDIKALDATGGVLAIVAVQKINETVYKMDSEVPEETVSHIIQIIFEHSKDMRVYMDASVNTIQVVSDQISFPEMRTFFEKIAGLVLKDNITIYFGLSTDISARKINKSIKRARRFLKKQMGETENAVLTNNTSVEKVTSKEDKKHHGDVFEKNAEVGHDIETDANKAEESDTDTVRAEETATDNNMTSEDVKNEGENSEETNISDDIEQKDQSEEPKTIDLNITAPNISININGGKTFQVTKEEHVDSGKESAMTVVEKEESAHDNVTEVQPKPEEVTAPIILNPVNEFPANEPDKNIDVEVKEIGKDSPEEPDQKKESITDGIKHSDTVAQNDVEEPNMEDMNLLPEEMCMDNNSSIQISFEEVPLAANQSEPENKPTHFTWADIKRDEGVKSGQDNLFEDMEDFSSNNQAVSHVVQGNSDGIFEDMDSVDEINEADRRTSNDAKREHASTPKYNDVDFEDLFESVEENPAKDISVEDSAEDNVSDTEPENTKKEYQINKDDLLICSTDIMVQYDGSFDSYDISVMSYERFGQREFIGWLNGYHGDENELILEDYTITGNNLRYDAGRYCVNINPYIDEKYHCNAGITVTGEVISSVSKPYVSGNRGEGCIHIRENGTDIFVFPLSSPTPDFPMDDGAEYIASIYSGMEHNIVTGSDGRLRVGTAEYRVFWEKETFCCVACR